MRPPADLSPRRTAALVVRGPIPDVERFMAGVGRLAESENVFVVYQRTARGKLRIVDEEEASA